jgi:hypothetical protein
MRSRNPEWGEEGVADAFFTFFYVAFLECLAKSHRRALRNY